jgi:tRNA modification GTPase
MYELNDTIVAVSSPTSDRRVIVRITGPRTIEICEQIFDFSISDITEKQNRVLTAARVKIDEELQVDARMYLFFAPHSYTGDDAAEIHLYTNSAVTEALIDNLTSRGLRTAGPGEFTARAYLNGKIDLAQAEAVNEIIVSSNTFQLAAAEKLLSGRLSEATAKVRSAIMDCLSLIEAGLDFSAEDIELESSADIIERLSEIIKQLEQMLSGSIRYESLIDLPAVGIAGAPNAGKSSLLNKVLGKERSIVSHSRKTTRDVLTAVCELERCGCVLFDCAGLVREAENILDELAQEAAIEALRNSSVVIFCIDISKGDWSEDISIRELIEPKALIPVATKCDLVTEKVLSARLADLKEIFGIELLVTSAVTGAGLELLGETIERKIIELEPGFREDEGGVSRLSESTRSSVALTARHKQAVTEAIGNIKEAIGELRAGNDEVAAMMLRAGYEAVSGIESVTGRAGRVDEQILGQIFGHFCIGK